MAIIEIYSRFVNSTISCCIVTCMNTRNPANIPIEKLPVNHPRNANTNTIKKIKNRVLLNMLTIASNAMRLNRRFSAVKISLSYLTIPYRGDSD